MSPNTTGDTQSRVKSHAIIGAASILKRHDNSSLMLWQNLLEAKVIPQVTMDVTHTASNGFATQMRYTLNDVIVSHFEDGFESSAHSSDHEYLQLSFTKIEKRRTPYDSKGKAGAPMTVGYDVAEASVA